MLSMIVIKSHLVGVLKYLTIAAMVTLQAFDASVTHTTTVMNHPCCYVHETNPILKLNNGASFPINMALFAGQDIARGAAIRFFGRHAPQEDQDIAQEAANIFQIVQSSKGINTNIHAFDYIRQHGN